MAHGQQAWGQRVFVDQSPLRVVVVRAHHQFLGQGVKGLLHGVVRRCLAGEHGVVEQRTKGLGYIARLQILCLQRLLASAQRAHAHAVLRQRAGFVHAQHRGLTQGFNRPQAPCQHLQGGQAPRGQGREYQQNDRQFLRQHRHGQSDARQQSAQGVASQPPKPQRQRHAQRQPDQRQALGQAFDFELQGRRCWRYGLQGMADRAHLRFQARGGDPHHALAAHHQRARIHGNARRVFVHWRRFAGEQRLVNGQLVRLQQRAIGRHAPAFAEQEHVVTHHIVPGQLHRLAAAHGGGLRAGQITQRFQSIVGAPLLQHRGQHDDQHKTHQEQGFAGVPQGQVNQARRHQQ